MHFQSFWIILFLFRPTISHGSQVWHNSFTFTINKHTRSFVNKAKDNIKFLIFRIAISQIIWCSTTMPSISTTFTDFQIWITLLQARTCGIRGPWTSVSVEKNCHVITSSTFRWKTQFLPIIRQRNCSIYFCTTLRLYL